MGQAVVDAAFVRDLFAEFGPVDIKRMFGGAGIFADGVMFGLVTGGVIYLKTDDTTREAFRAENSAPFQFSKKSGQEMVTSYWRLPERLYDDPDELAGWARKALSVARAKKAKPAARKVSAAKKSTTSKRR